MERREERRIARRIEVRFWRRGEAQPHSGFTINVSSGGLFLGTGVALDSGERLRMEFIDPQHGFLIEGVVVRTHRVALMLRQVEQAGAGVRFLKPIDLLAEFLKSVRGAASAIPAPDAPRMPAAMTSPDRPASGAPSGPGREPRAAPGPARLLDTAPGPATRAVEVDFTDRSTFLSVYYRDLANGALFVSTATPAALNEVVWISIRVPVDGVEPILCQARVAHRFDPKAVVGQGTNVLSGMGVQILDPERVKALVAPILDRIRAER